MRKVVEEAVREALRTDGIEDEVSLATQLLHIVRLAVMTETTPDKVEVRTPFVGMPYVAVVKKLPGPVKDAWSHNVEEDAVCVEKLNIVGLDGPFTIHEGLSEERKNELMGRKYKFLLLSSFEQEQLIEEMAKYISLDCDDVRGPLLGAMYAVGCSSRSPNPEWNARVEALRLAEQQARDAEIEEKCRRIGVPWERDGDVVSLKTAHGTYEVALWKLDDFPTYLASMDQWAEEIEAIKAGTKPVLNYLGRTPEGRRVAVEAFLVPLRAREALLKVPESLVPLVIGKGGTQIKGIVTLLGGLKIRVMGTEGEAYPRTMKILVPLPPRLPLGVKWRP